MIWTLPTEIKIDDDIVYHITQKCDYRVVLDVIVVLNDEDFNVKDRIIIALIMFYEELTRDNISECAHLEILQKEMFRIINGGEEENQSQTKTTRLMDWEHDFSQLAPPISRVLGFEIRSVEYLHWYSFLGGFQEIGDCMFATIVSIRLKMSKNKKLEKWEEEYLMENRKKIYLPQKLTAEEQEFLNSDW